MGRGDRAGSGPGDLCTIAENNELEVHLLEQVQVISRKEGRQVMDISYRHEDRQKLCL
jgi:hypothetical protein